jgi:DNA-binding NarL/FixJ family response regulator
MLAVALVAFPGGRVRGAASWVLVTLAGLTALQLMSQLGVAALFAVIAVVALARSRYRPNHRVPAHAAQRPDSPLTHLTPRERDILALMTEGRSNSGIAGELGISDEPSRRPAPSPSPADAQ